MNDKIQINGFVTIYLNDKVIADQKNLITTIGKEFLLRKMAGFVSDEIALIKIGTGNTAAAVGDIDVESEADSKVLESVVVDATSLNAYVLFEMNDGAADLVIAELGLFNTSNEMISRIVLDTPITKTASDLLAINWRLTIV